MSQKFLLGAVCAGLMLNSLIHAGKSFAEGTVASIPQEMFMTKDELLQLCEGRTGENSLLAGKDTDKKIRINFGTRPEVVKYYSDWGNTSHEVAARPMTWLLVGSEDGNSAVLYSEKPIISAKGLDSNSDSRFQIDTSNKKYTPEADSGYPSIAEIDVYPNHWGASKLRGQLNALFNSSNWFTTEEKALMAQSKITTSDTLNKDASNNFRDCTTSDMLYAPRLKSSDYDGTNTAVIAGEANNFMINKAYCEALSWLCSPYPNYYGDALVAVPGSYVDGNNVLNTGPAVVAAFKLDVQPFSFLSAASSVAITHSGEAFDQIAEDTPMTLRIDGSSQDMGTAMFSENKTAVTVQNAQGAALIVQGMTASGENWSYQKTVTSDSDTITIEAISNANAAASAPDNVPDLALVDFENCKVWLKKPTEPGSSLSYAVMATDFVPSEKPETPGDSTATPGDGGSEGNKTPDTPAEAPDKDNQNGTVDNQESSLDIVKTGDTVTCFALSTLSLAAALPFGALLNSKISKRKSN